MNTLKRYIVTIPCAGDVHCYAENGVQAREHAAYERGLRQLPPGTVVIELHPPRASEQLPSAA